MTIDLIAEYLEAARRGEIKRLIINMPPRALKSICVSVAWPAWVLGHAPQSRIMAASYAAGLSLKHSLDCRLVMQAPWYSRIFPATKLAYRQNERHKFVTTERGYRIATSVGGTATGEGGNFLIIDDPISPAKAYAQNGREAVNRWFEHTFSSRLDDKRRGVIVLVMQRLHVEDLSGYLLEKGGWEHLCLPAVADMRLVHDFGRIKKTRSIGELLHLGREDSELIEQAKLELGSSAFAAQYQQQPIPEAGGMVRPWWFKRHQLAPPLQRIVQSWDTAIKSGLQHDASVCMTVGETENCAYILDVQVMRLEYPELKRAVLALAKKWCAETILMEDKASGQQLLQDIRREHYLPLIAIAPKGDKVTRFAAVTALIEAGGVSLPFMASWLPAFEMEVMGFPTAAHDDQVDALSQYLDWRRVRALGQLGLRRI